MEETEVRDCEAVRIKYCSDDSHGVGDLQSFNYTFFFSNTWMGGEKEVGEVIQFFKAVRLIHQVKRTKSHTERVHVLDSHSSPLCSIALKDVFNFDEFIQQFTNEEQKKLKKLLPRSYSDNLPDRTKKKMESGSYT